MNMTQQDWDTWLKADDDIVDAREDARQAHYDHMAMMRELMGDAMTDDEREVYG